MKHWFFGIPTLIMILILTACNLRENLTLPPDLIPEDYITGNYIYTAGNFMVKSTNDDAFLYINESAISDSTIHLLDSIVFERVEALTERDTLHVNTTDVLSSAYRFMVYRDSSLVQLNLNVNYPHLTIYTQKTGALPIGSQSFCLNQYIWFDAQPATVENYADDRIAFHPFGTGINQMVAIDPQANDLSFTADAGNHFAFLFGTQDRASYYLPVTTDGTQIDITSHTELDTVSAHRIQALFPGFAVFSSVTGITSSHALGTSTAAPLIKLHNTLLPNRFPLQWIVQSSTQTYAWEESAETWQMTGYDLIAPCRINGKYLLIVPLETQTDFDIPLDAGFGQIFCHDLWADVTGLSLNGITMSIDFTPDSAQMSYMTSHYQDHPYDLDNLTTCYQVRFVQNGSVLESLPDAAYLELGTKATVIDQSTRFYRFYTDNSQDSFTYKTYSTAYDATHYEYDTSGGYIYHSISQSGIYFLNAATESTAGYTVPLLKNTGLLQTTQGYIHWTDQANIGNAGLSMVLRYNSADTDMNYIMTNYSGHPYQISGIDALYKLTFLQNGTAIENLPGNYWLEIGRTVTNSTQTDRLYRYYGDPSKDSFTYKTYAAAYDATHFTYGTTTGNLYHSVTQSGNYFLSSGTENASGQTIPVLKSTAEFQTAKTYIYWSGADSLFTQYSISYPDNFTTTNPWFNGQPFSMPDYHGYVQANFFQNGVGTASVPSVYYLEFNLPDTQSYQHLISFSELGGDYTAKLFTPSTTADADHFTQTGNRIACYPLYGGTLIFGNIVNLDAASFDVAMFKRMYIEFDQVKMWMQTDLPLAAGTALQVSVADVPIDPLNILSTQYSLSATSKTYNLAVTVEGTIDPTFYAVHQPLVYLKRHAATSRKVQTGYGTVRSGRRTLYKYASAVKGKPPRFSQTVSHPAGRTEYLFTIANDTFKRIYTYPAGDYNDGYHYTEENGYNQFYMSHYGQFATFVDNNPHSQLTRVLTNPVEEFTLSLYQAEFILPNFYANMAQFQGLNYQLVNVTDLSSLPGAVSANRLRIYNANNQNILPGYVTNFVTANHPLLYIPFSPEYEGQTINLFYVNPANVTTQFTLVEDMNDINQFILYGNCAVCLVNNPGTYYITVTAARPSKLSKNMTGNH